MNQMPVNKAPDAAHIMTGEIYLLLQNDVSPLLIMFLKRVIKRDRINLQGSVGIHTCYQVGGDVNGHTYTFLIVPCAERYLVLLISNARFLCFHFAGSQTNALEKIPGTTDDKEEGATRTVCRVPPTLNSCHTPVAPVSTRSV